MLAVQPADELKGGQHPELVALPVPVQHAQVVEAQARADASEVPLCGVGKSGIVTSPVAREDARHVGSMVVLWLLIARRLRTCRPMGNLNHRQENRPVERPPRAQSTA